MSRPIKIKIEYDDGTSRESVVDKLSPDTQKELKDLGLLIADPDENRYIVVEWKDGWKEVYRAPSNTIDLRKYFVIERKEEVGRLYLEKEGAYPELVQILRKPNEVKRVSLL